MAQLLLPRSYPGVVRDWIGGDTAVVALNTDWETVKTIHVRLHGINAPAHNTDAGRIAMTFAGVLAPAGVLVSFTYLGHDTDGGRVQGNLTLADGRDVATEIVKAGHAKPWDGQGVKPV